MMVRDLVGIVTGAGGAIGFETSLEFLRQGGKVLLVDRGEELLSAAAQKLSQEGFGDRFATLCRDITVAGVAEEAVAEAELKFGDYNVLVNNAGITLDGSVGRMSDEQFDAVIAVNLKAPFRLTRASIARWLGRLKDPAFKPGNCSIVNISSVIGERGNKGQANYAASKGGLVMFTKSAARELAAKRIRVNCVAPGFIKTPMTDAMEPEELQRVEAGIPMGRRGLPSEVAKKVVVLASPEWGGYMTGTVLIVDGGYLLV